MRVLAVAGSLRAASDHATLLAAAALLAPAGCEVVRWNGLAGLPHFNPDLDADPLPAPVAALRRLVAESDALLVSSPEYAHGVPGALKNALDWLVSGVELPGKAAALWSNTTGVTFVRTQLEETLRVMSTRFVTEACVALPLRGKRLDAAAIAAHPEYGPALRGALRELLRAAEEPPPGA